MASQPLNQALSITQGATAQSWAGPTMAENNTTLGNTSEFQPITGPNPEDARPGYLAAGQPGGANVAIIPNTNGNGASGGNLQTNAPNAGTAGGGGYYPTAAAGPAKNPMLVPGWTVQSYANEDLPAQVAWAPSPSPLVHAVGGTVTPTVTPAATISAAVVKTVNGVETATLPTGFTIAAGTGVITVSSAAATAGIWDIVVELTTSNGQVAAPVTVVLT